MKKILKWLDKNTIVTALLVFIVISALSVLIYLVGMLVNNEEHLSPIFQIIEILIAFSAGVLVFIELAKGSEAEESQFILEQNKVFMESDKLREVEKHLDENLVNYENNKKFQYSNVWYFEKNRGDLINYLVYLEGLSSELISGVLGFEEVDNVFSYRFFVVMNSIEAQQIEIIGHEQYYLGCVRIYGKWLNYRKEKFKLYDTIEKDGQTEYIPFEATSFVYTPNYEKYIENPIFVQNDGFENDGYKYTAKLADKKEVAKCIVKIDGNTIEFFDIKKECNEDAVRALLKSAYEKLLNTNDLKKTKITTNKSSKIMEFEMAKDILQNYLEYKEALQEYENIRKC